MNAAWVRNHPQFVDARALGNGHHVQDDGIGQGFVSLQEELLLVLYTGIGTQFVLQLLIGDLCFAQEDIFLFVYGEDEFGLVGLKGEGACLGQVNFDTGLDEGCCHHKNNEEHQHDIHHRCDVNFAESGTRVALLRTHIPEGGVVG